jgi:hypothetical protein
MRTTVSFLDRGPKSSNLAPVSLFHLLLSETPPPCPCPDAQPGKIITSGLSGDREAPAQLVITGLLPCSTMPD